MEQQTNHAQKENLRTSSHFTSKNGPLHRTPKPNIYLSLIPQNTNLQTFWYKIKTLNEDRSKKQESVWQGGPGAPGWQA